MSFGEYLGAGSGVTKGLYHLNGNSIDSSGNGNNGTDSNVSYVTGKFGQCGSFTNSNGYIQLSNESNFDFERTSTFTISMWIKRVGFNGENIFICKQANSSPYRGWVITSPSTHKIRFALINTVGTNHLEVDAPVISDTTLWHNIIVTYNGNSLPSGVRIYYDGVSQSLTTTVNNLSATILNDTNVEIGNRGSGTGAYANSLIDEIIIENIAWTPEQIKKYYTYTKGRFGIT